MRYSDLKAMWGRKCFTLLIAMIALAIFELTEFTCFFHVICGSIYIPRNFTVSSLFRIPIWLIISLFIVMLRLTSKLLFCGLYIHQFVFFTLRDNLFAHSQSYNNISSWLVFIIRLSAFGPD